MKKLLILLISIHLFSCSSNHSIYIHKDNSATVEFSIENKASLVETLIEWGAVQDTSGEIIDVNQVKNDLSSDKNLSEVVFKSNKINKYNGSFFVKNIDELFNNNTKGIPPELQIFNIVDKGGIKTLTIRISIDNYEYLKQSVPALQDENIDLFGPTANVDVSQEEYLDMMSFSLGDDGPKDILDSSIKLYVSVDGLIKDVKGGMLQSKNKAEFIIPLLDLVLLKKTLTYSVSYR